MIAKPALPVVIVGIVFTTLSFAVILARLYTRLFLVRHWGPEDGIMCAAMVASFGMLSVLLLRKYCSN